MSDQLARDVAAVPVAPAHPTSVGALLGQVAAATREQDWGCRGSATLLDPGQQQHARVRGQPAAVEGGADRLAGDRQREGAPSVPFHGALPRGSGYTAPVEASAPDRRDEGGRWGLAARAGLGPVRAGVPRQRRRRRGPARAGRGGPRARSAWPRSATASGCSRRSRPCGPTPCPRRSRRRSRSRSRMAGDARSGPSADNSRSCFATWSARPPSPPGSTPRTCARCSAPTTPASRWRWSGRAASSPMADAAAGPPPGLLIAGVDFLGLMRPTCR